VIEGRQWSWLFYADQADYQYKHLSALVNEELKHYFRPEFLTGFDEIIVFRQLTKDEVKQISSILLREVCRFEKGISLEVTARFNDRLVEEGYNPSYGARPLPGTRLLSDSLAEETSAVASRWRQVVDVDDDGQIQFCRPISKNHCPSFA